MGSISAAIYRVGSDRVEVVAAIDGFGGLRQGDKITERVGVPFPGSTNVIGLSLGKDDRPTVVLPEFGVFELAGKPHSPTR
jgi:hypothetical protein